MRTKVRWIVLGLLFFPIFVLTFLKTPDAITNMLENVSNEAKAILPSCASCFW